MAGIFDRDFYHKPGKQLSDSLGTPLCIGDNIAHITKIASRIRVSRRKILAVDLDKGTMTISPREGRFSTHRPGYNVRGENVLRLCKCQL